MLKNVFFVCLVLLTLETLGQSTNGITGKPDTSYSNYTAFVSSRKSHPDIKLVKEMAFPKVKETREIVYCTLGNRKLLIDAFVPKAKGKNPAILIIHGGGWRSGNRTQHYPLAQHLAKAGYACFTPEYRLSTEALFPAAIYDLKAALRWIRENAKTYNVDTSRIAVLGFSAGGELAAFLGVTNNNDKYEGTGCHDKYSSVANAIVDLDGTLSFVHPESGEGNDRKSPSAATYWFGYPKLENPELWEEASPLTHVGKDTPPTLFINSSVERMHAGRDDFRKVLDQHNIYSEVHTFEGSPHSFVLFEPWFHPTVKHITGFLDKVFRGKRSGVEGRR